MAQILQFLLEFRGDDNVSQLFGSHFAFLTRVVNPADCAVKSLRENANGRVECLDLDGANDCEWTAPLPNGLNLNTMNGIPQEIGNLSDLKRLYIGYNPNLIGTIPTTIGRLSKLEKLYLEVLILEFGRKLMNLSDSSV